MTNEPLRDVLLDNKQTVYGVPDEITDEEVKDAYKQNDKDSILEDVKDYFTSKQNIETDTALKLGTLLGLTPGSANARNRDIVKATVNMGANAYETVVGGLKSVFDQFETKEEKEQFFVNLQKQKPEIYNSIIKTLRINPSVDEIFTQSETDPTKLRPVYETSAGAATELLPYIPAVGLKLPAAIAAEVAVNQLVANPEDNLIDALKEYVPTEEGFEIVKEAITAEDLSEQQENRAKLLLTDAVLAGLILPVKVAEKGYAIVKEFQTKPMSMLSAEEKAELYFLGLRDSKKQVEKQANIRRTEKEILAKENKFFDFRNIFSNTGAALTRLKNSFFTSRGFLPEPLYREQLKIVRKNKQTLENAGDLAKRLNQTISQLAGENAPKSDKIKQLSVEVLTTKFPEFLSFSTKENAFKTIRLNPKFDDLSDDVVNTLIEARGTIDSLSGQLLKTFKLENVDGAKSELKLKINKNFGAYLNRAYEKHEGGWTPSKKVIEDGIDYFAEILQKRNPNTPPERILQQAEQEVVKIVGDPSLRGGVDFDTFNQATSGILKGKKEIPVEVRKLMGEIVDPSDQVLTTITKLSNLVSKQKFYDEFLEQGTKGKYLFDPAKGVVNKRIYSVEIEGTDSPLDGLFTTPELAIALKNRETALTPLIGHIFTGRAAKDKSLLPYVLPTVLGNKSAIANMAEAKGASQKMQTVWRLLSHLRNASGGSFLAFSNGHNPFSKVPEVFKTISKTDALFQKKYEELQGLGVVSSSTRFSEFKELINEYKTLVSENPDELVAAEKFYNRSSQIASKIGTKNYNLKTADDFLQKAYVGTDDFFKTSLYEKELETLKKAFPLVNELELKKEAATIVTKTMPVYEEVFKGIKGFRNNPFFSSFVSFPAEMYRTTIHKFTRATAEIASGNPVLIKRGLERSAGLGITLGGGVAVEKATSALVGWSEEKLQAFRTLESSDFGEQSYIFSSDKNGKTIAHNISYTDPNQNIKAPILRITSSLREGEITEEEANDKYLKVLTDTLFESVKPFTSESVLNSATGNFIVALYDGRRAGGNAVKDVIEGDDIIERFPDAFTNFMFDIGPGLLKEGVQLANVVSEDPQGFFLEPKRMDLHMSKYLTTALAQEVNTYQSIEKAFKLYEIKDRKISSGAADKKKASVVKEESFFDGTGFVDSYININNAKRENAQNLYLKMKAFEDFHSDSRTTAIEANVFLKNLVKEYGSDFEPIYNGLSPVDTFDNTRQIMKVAERLIKRGELPDDYYKFRRELSKYNVNPSQGRELNKSTSQTKFVFENVRTGKAVGGEVDVPRAAPEPDERIDKMTGLPYNIQAGIPFRDEEDPIKRLGLAGGGMTSDPMQRLGFAAGGVNIIAKGVKAGKEFIEVGAKEVSDALKYIVDIPDKEVSKISKNIKTTADGSVDDVAKSLEQAPVKNINKEISLDQYIKERTAIDKAETPKEWKENAKQLVKDTRKVDPVIRTPELEKSAQAFKADLITRGEHLENIDLYKPVKPFTSLTIEPSDKALVFSLNDDQMKQGFFVLDQKTVEKFNVAKSPLSIGDFFKGRLDIPAYNSYDTWIVAGKAKGVDGTHYAKAVHYIGKEGEPVTFTASPKAEKILTGEEKKSTIAFINGFIKDLDPVTIRKKANELLQDPEWTQVGFDPRRQTNFYVREGNKAGTPVKAANEVIQIGPLVLAKNVELDLVYKGIAKGGLINIDSVSFMEGGKVLKALSRKKLATGREVDPSMFRADGSRKSAIGFLGQIKNKITGGTMTEFSTDMMYKGKKIEIPTLVPTQSKEAIEHMQNMEPGKGWNMKDPINKQIINTAREHAKMRLAQGKSQFYVDGEEQRLNKAEGSLLDYVAEKARSTSAISSDKQLKMAKKLGFNKQDLKDATTFGETYSRASQDGGKGDAARHIGLGWAAAQTDNPDTAYKIITARDVGLGLFSGEGKLGVAMDIHNNKLGFNLGHLSKEKMQEAAKKLIESGEAKTIR